MTRSSIRRSAWLRVTWAVLFLGVLAGIAALMRPDRALQSTAAFAEEPPHLVVVIVIDQLRYESLTALRDKFGPDGFNRFLREGASFKEARYRHGTTDTCPGHAAVATGTWASSNGVIANRWVSAGSGAEVDCAGGTREQLARRLLRPTVGELLESASDGASKVIAVSGKRAAAALLAGPTADAAWWPDGRGRFVSWDGQAGAVPAWVNGFNFERAAGDTGDAPPGHCPRTSTDDERAADDAITAFAIAALANEGMGRDRVPDLLAVSYSGSDVAGHRHGAESAEWTATIQCIDRQIARLLDVLDDEFGRNNTLVVLTADHGVAPLPEAIRMSARDRAAGRIDEDAITAVVNEALASAYGDTFGGRWVAFHDFPNVWLSEPLALAKDVSLADAARVAQAAVASRRGIKTAYVQDELQAWHTAGEAPSAAQSVLLSFHPERSGHVIYQVDRFHVVAAAGSNHGSHWEYDAHVPLMWLGPGIRAGSYDSRASPVDIAPTLLELLGIRDPPEMNGCVLGEALIAGGPPCDRDRLLQPTTGKRG